MKKPHYTDKDILQIRILFEQKRSDDEIAAIMGRGVTGIRQKRRQLGLHRPDAVAISKKKGHKWTEDELQFIRNYWHTKTDEWMANKLRVTVSTYKHKRQRMTVQTMNGKKHLVKTWTHRKGRHATWTFTQEEFLREHYPTHAAKDIALYLGRGENAIQWKARRMGLKKAYSCGRRGYQPIEQYYNADTFTPRIIK